MRYEVTTATATGAVASAPRASAIAAMNTMLTGARRNDPGTAASMHDTASAIGMSGNARYTTVPAVPPMKINGNTLPPMKPTSRLRAIATILATRTTISRPIPSAA